MLKFLLFFVLITGAVGAQPVPSLDDLPSPPPPLDSSKPILLSLPQALERALGAHPTMVAAQARVRSAYWAYQKASSLPATQVTLASIPGTNVAGSKPGGNNPSGAGAGFATFAADGRTDHYVQVTQPFLPFGSLSKAQAVANRDFQLAKAAWLDMRVMMRQQLKDAYYTLLAWQATNRAVQENLFLAQESYQIARSRLEAGAGPKLDLIDAGVLLSRARQDQVKSEASLRQAQAALAPLLSLPASANIQASDELGVPESQLDFEKLLAEAEASPKVQAALASVERARASVELAQSQANPNPMLTFVRDLTTHTYQFQIGLQIPLDWGQISNDVRSKEETLSEQQQNLQATRLSLSSNLKVSVEQYLGAVKNAAEFREKILVPSEESTRITQYGFKRGAVPYVRLLTSQQNLTAVRKEYISLLQSAWISLDAVEAAAGRESETP